MKFTYSPENGEHREWTVNLDRILSSDSIAIEELFKGTKTDFDMAVLQGSTFARKIMLWYLLRQEHAKLRLADVPPFYSGEIEVELDADDLRSQRRKIAKIKGIPEADRRTVIEAIDEQLAAFASESSTINAEVAAEDSDPKSSMSLRPINGSFPADWE